MICAIFTGYTVEMVYIFALIYIRRKRNNKKCLCINRSIEINTR